MYSKKLFIITLFMLKICDAFLFLPNLNLINGNNINKNEYLHYNGDNNGNGGGNNNLINGCGNGGNDDDNNFYYLLIILNICLIKLTYNNNTNIFDLLP